MAKKQEYWDIYTEDRELTGRKMKRNDFHMQPGEFHITVLGVIHRPSDDRFLITQRVLTKAWAPGHWEVSGGGVQAGETPDAAIRREIFEETGIDVAGAEGGHRFSYTRINPDEGDNYFVDIYRYEVEASETDVILQEDEAADWRFATREEITELGEAGIFLHYSSIREIFDL